jgi:hypothetical protein
MSREAEMACAMGADRPYLNQREIEEQARKVGVSIEEWNRLFDEKIKNSSVPF